MENIKRRYDRFFIMFKQELSGYSIDGREPNGNCKIEIRDGKGKASTYIQGLKPLKDGSMYRAYIMAVQGDKTLGVPIGWLDIDNRGRGECKWEFNPDNLDGTGLVIEDFTVGAILIKGDNIKELIAPVVGYKDKEVLWKNGFRDFSNYNIKTETKKQPEAITKVENSKPIHIELDKQKNSLNNLNLLEKEKSSLNNLNLLGKEKNPSDNLDLLEKEKNSLNNLNLLGKEKNPSDNLDLLEKGIDFLNNLNLLEKTYSNSSNSLDKQKDFSNNLKSLDKEKDFSNNLKSLDKEKDFSNNLKSLDKEKDFSNNLKSLDKEKDFSNNLKSLDKKKDFSNNLKSLDKEKISLSNSEEDNINPHQIFNDMVTKFYAEMEELEKYKILNSENMKMLDLNLNSEEVEEELEKQDIDDITYIFDNNEAVIPFERPNRAIQWIKIEPFELVTLNLSVSYIRHQFINASWKKYKHLTLGRYSQNSIYKYILGVPDIYNDKYKSIASDLGFKKFVCYNGRVPQKGNLGYWLMEL